VSAPTTVDVGSQVSGTIRWLGADFNSVVHKGDVLARLDPAAYEAQVAAAAANLARATADAYGVRAAVEDSRNQDGRARALAAQQLITQSDLDDADVAWKEAQAQLRSAEATPTS
jgi:HlyD family secretion protein